jgi:streptogramin lyase
VGTNAVWATSEAGTLTRIDPRTHEVTAVPVGGVPRAVDVGAGNVWVSVN